MKTYNKPLPTIQPWSEEFWKGTKQEKLLIQECKQCGSKIFYPRKNCPECWSPDLAWRQASGRAKVFSYSVTYAGVEEHFYEDIPFVLALVDLEEGVRMMTNIIGCKPEDVSIGMDLKVVFDHVTKDIALPKWRPVSS